MLRWANGPRRWANRPGRRTGRQHRAPLRTLALIALASILFLASVAATAPAAHAHAELLQSSPAPGSVVGGEFHSIVLHFGGIDWEGSHLAEVFGPDGVKIVTPEPIHERQRLVIPLEPLTVPGNYTVRYTIEGDDNDTTSESMMFRFDPSAARPEGVTLANGGETGFDLVGFGLLLVGAGLLAFLVARFVTASKQHRRAAAVPPHDD